MSEEMVWTVDARTGERSGPVAAGATDADVDGTARRAAEVAPALGAAGPDGRARLLRGMADEIEKDADAIIVAADRETALGSVRLRGELGRTVYQLRLFADVLADGGYLDLTIDHRDPTAVPAAMPDLRRMMVPIGPVGVFSASNFPLAFSVPGGDTASAIAAGCPVVVKAHPGHPLTSELCATALRRAAGAADLPEDVVQLLHGLPAGRAMVTHPAIAAIAFTGSLAGGRALYDLAVARPQPIPFYGELGSSNPFVVTPAAAAERAESIAEGLAGSFTLGLGQFCTKPGLVFVPTGPVGQRLVAALAEAAARVAAGPMLTAGIQQSFTSGVAHRAGLPGVRAVLRTPEATGPAVLVAQAAALRAELLEECFGPVVVVIEYADEDELSTALARVPGSLTATVHCGESERVAGSFADRIGHLLAGQAGRVVFNGYPTGVAVTWAQHHGGPWPATTFAQYTSVGTAAIQRFLRPVAYQDVPDPLLPPELREANPLRLPRRVDGRPDLHP